MSDGLEKIELREFDPTLVGGMYEAPFFRFVAVEMPDWAKWLKVMRCTDQARERWAGVLMFPRESQSPFPLEVVGNGCDVVVAFDNWHTHLDIAHDALASKSRDTRNAVDAKCEKIRCGEVSDIAAASPVWRRAIEYIHSIWQERKVLVTEYNAGQYNGGSMLDSSQLEPAFESLKAEAFRFSDELRIYSARGTYDRVIRRDDA